MDPAEKGDWAEPAEQETKQEQKIGAEQEASTTELKKTGQAVSH